MPTMKNIKEIRQIERLTQTEFAKRLEVGRSYITQLEAGKTTLSERLKDKIRSVFELPADFAIEQVNLKAGGTAYSLNDMFKMHRAQLGLTQDAIASSLGVSKSYYSDVECNRRNVSVKLLAKFQQAYGDIDQLTKVDKGNNTISETLDNYRDSLTNDEFLSDHDYRVTVRVINRIKELLKDF
ncbi:helix-turn-helix transcriptional regulator [Sphingobacterium sp.]|uniref:helix-turn-helix transcriptional regulator n=1 Tax=Sphingobacterium sp. TaxID=341027 RepID=UPI00289BCAC2|nr:helix-turn-helix transcriptional regulator [Sphingobacterium sp.]